MSRSCGGCEGRGRHWRWCPEIVGPEANRWGVLSEQADDMADTVGANAPVAANALYTAASILLLKARGLADEFAVRGIHD